MLDIRKIDIGPHKTKDNAAETETMEDERTATPSSTAASSLNSNGGGTTTSGASPVSVETQAKRCAKCQKRVATKGCVLASCLQCCDAGEKCEKHLQIKEKNQWKEQVIAGTTYIQVQAREKRRMMLHKQKRTTLLREPLFQYAGDTVVIWSIYAYNKNNDWRDDAIRRSNRRKAREQDSALCAPAGTENNNLNRVEPKMKRLKTTPVRNSKKRFRRIMEKLYQESLVEEKKSAKDQS